MFQAIYGGLHDKVLSMAGITNVDNEFLSRVAKYSGLVSVDKNANRVITRKRVSELCGIDMKTLDKVLIPIENAWAVIDHTKCLCFMLSEGVVPSNIQEGYLARLLFRRVYRLMRNLNMDPAKLYDIIDMQVDYWSKDFPQFKTMQKEIIEMLKVEEEKFEDTLLRGEGMIKRITNELKLSGKKELPETTLSELYDSHGLPPEIVKQAAEKEGVKVDVPENFYALVAKRHMQASKPVEEEEAKAEDKLEHEAEKLAATEMLYYSNAYLKEFDAKVLKIINERYVVLDKTCFYPEGGGQPADHGFLVYGDSKVEVVDTQKIGKVIVHKINASPSFKEGFTVKGILDWDRRYSLMKAHTGTHLVNGAARRVLGEHVWQSGTQKGLETSRLDISHFRRLSQKEIHTIEMLANQAIGAGMPIVIKWYPRNEAESKYGFRLYQGGAVPGKDIRVVKTGNWDVEACAGTHLKNTSEVGFIKIVYTERVQDGVERLGYAVGLEAIKAIQNQESLLWNVAGILSAPLDKLDKTAEKLMKELKESRNENKRLVKEIAEKESETVDKTKSGEQAVEVAGVSLVKRDFGEVIDVNRMVQTASEIIKRNQATVAIFHGSDGKTGRIMIMAGETAVSKGVDANKIIKEVSPIINGGGGGRQNFAQGGGTKPENLQQAIVAAEQAIKRQLMKH